VTAPICASCNNPLSPIRWSSTGNIDGPLNKSWWCLTEGCVNYRCPACAEKLVATGHGTLGCSCRVVVWHEAAYYQQRKSRVEGEPSAGLEPERIWELVSSLRQVLRDVNALVGAIEGVKGNGLYDTERSRVATVVLGSVQRILDEEASSLREILADEAGYEAEWRSSNG
jgi:hypothetical protein